MSTSYVVLVNVFHRIRYVMVRMTVRTTQMKQTAVRRLLCTREPLCENVSVSLPIAVDCTTENQMRLENITTGYDGDNRLMVCGRVEICHNGTYGTACDVGWDDKDALVACKSFYGGDFYGGKLLLNQTTPYT